MKRAFHFQMEAETKLIKSNSVMAKSFISKSIQPNGYRNTYIHIYIYVYANCQTQSVDRMITQSYKLQQPNTVSDCKYIQSAISNLSMIERQDDVVIVNTKNNKENMKLHICKPCTCIFIINICTHIY